MECFELVVVCTCCTSGADRGLVAQLAERCTGSADVRGSNPFKPMKLYNQHCSLLGKLTSVGDDVCP